MTDSPPPCARLGFLLETVMLEAEHLRGTDARLFAQPFTAERAATLRADVDLAERVVAFAARFARLHDDPAGDREFPPEAAQGFRNRLFTPPFHPPPTARPAARPTSWLRTA